MSTNFYVCVGLIWKRFGSEGEEFAGMAFVRRCQRLSLSQAGPVLASSRSDLCDGDGGSAMTRSRKGKYCCATATRRKE